MKKKLKTALDTLKKGLDLSSSEKEVFKSLADRIDSMEEAKLEVGDISVHKGLVSDDFDLVVYSDGACRGNPGPGSFGLYVENKSGAVYQDSEVFDITTNNKMELLGIIKGLEFAKSKNAQNILVVTDSKYAINGMESWVQGWKSRGWKKADKKTPENVEMWQILDSLKTEFVKLKFEWVKGHSGHPQNELCDQLANIALDEAGY